MTARVLVTLLVVLLAGGGATTTAEPAGAARCARAADGQIRVAVVVDFGDAPGAPAGALARCVTVSERASGMDALRAATGATGHDDSTKVCQIAGFPKDFDERNCSRPTDGRISYWAYFAGTTSGWSYRSVGAAGVRARADVVEGWRYVTESAGQQRPAPAPRNVPEGATYLASTACPPPLATRPPAPRPPSQRPPAQGIPAAPAPTPTASATGAPGSTTTTPASTTTTTVAPGSSTTDAPTTTSGQVVPRLSRAEVAEAAAEQDSSARPMGAVVAGVGGTGAVVVALAVVTRRSRRRRATETDL